MHLFFFLLGLGIICHFCKRNSLPQYQATMPDGKLYNFCNSSCVAKFQVCYFLPLTHKMHIENNYHNILFSFLLLWAELYISQVTEGLAELLYRFDVIQSLKENEF